MTKRNENILLCFNAQNMTPNFSKRKLFRQKKEKMAKASEILLQTYD